MDSNSQRIKPFYWLLGSAALVIVIAGMRSAQSLVVPLLISGFIAVICTPALQWLQKKGVPGWLAILIVFLGVSVVVMTVVGVTADSVRDFVENAPEYTEGIQDQTVLLVNWIEAHSKIKVTDEIKKILDPTVAVRFTTFVLASLKSALSNAFLVLLTVLFILVEATGFPRKLMALSQGNSNILDQSAKIRDAISHYVSLKTAVSLLTAVLVGILVSVLGIKYPMLWAMLAFFFNFIPNIGSIIAAVPA